MATPLDPSKKERPQDRPYAFADCIWLDQEIEKRRKDMTQKEDTELTKVNTRKAKQPKYDITNPKEVVKYKQYLLEQAHDCALNGEERKVIAFKHMMDMVVEAEKTYNIARQEQLEAMESKIEDLESSIETLLSQNADLQAQLSQKSAIFELNYDG